MAAQTGRRVTAAGLRAPVLVGAAGLAAAVVLHVRDPHDSGTYGTCPFLQLTGRPCPGCGGLRAVNDLTRGDLVGAVSSNLVAVVLVLGAVAAWVTWLVRRVRGGGGFPVTLGPRTAVVAVALLVVFSVVRTTPYGSWLAP